MPVQRRIALKMDLEWLNKRHTEASAGAHRYAAEQGWEVVIDEFVAERLSTPTTKRVQYDGVIGRIDWKLARRAGALNLPVVNVWHNSPAMRKLPGVFPDFAASGRLRAEHLFSRGFRKFAALGRSDRPTRAEMAAFREAVRAGGAECISASLPMHPTRAHGAWRAAERILQTWMDTWQLPMGVFCAMDEVGRLVAQECKRRGWRVPQDVAIVAGFNDEYLCEYPHPSLTSVDMGYDRIGYEAGRLLDSLMQAKDRKARKPATPRHIILPPSRLVVRESTDFFVVEDPVVADAIAFISANSTKDIGQHDVAKAVATETRTLQARFRKALGRPIAATIRLLRLERAKRELLEGDRLTKSIAKSSGFGTAANMNNCFLAELGITPTEFRRQRQVRPDKPSQA